MHGRVKKFDNALFVFKVTKNLLLVGALANKRCVVVFGSKNCWVITTNEPNKVIVKKVRDEFNGLYKLEVVN
jgi:hypothetical protein